MQRYYITIVRGVEVVFLAMGPQSARVIRDLCYPAGTIPRFSHICTRL